MMAINLKIEESKTLDDGSHVGVITNIFLRDNPYQYVDFCIETKNKVGESMNLTCGFPAKITGNSLLGNLIRRFGGKIVVGELFDVEKFFIGRRVAFLTMASSSDAGTFTTILRNTIKPAPVNVSRGDFPPYER